MATKTKGKAKPVASSEQRGASEKPATPVKPIDVTKLDDELFDYNGLGSRLADAKYEAAKEKVESLRDELRDAEEELEFAARGLRLVESAMQKALALAAQGEQIYDKPLRELLGKVRLRIPAGWDGASYRTKAFDTGAKPWKDLARDGASDDQIKRNLKSIGAGRDGKADYALHGSAQGVKLVKRVRKGRYGAHWRTIVAGEKLIAEVRRVKGIPQPVAKSSTEAKTPGKSRASAVKRKPAAKAKSSAPQKKTSATRLEGAASRGRGGASRSSSPAAAGGKKPAAKAPAATSAKKRSYPSGAEKRRRAAERAQSAGQLGDETGRMADANGNEIGDALGFNGAAQPGAVNSNEVPAAIASRGKRAKPTVAQQAATRRNGQPVGA